MAITYATPTEDDLAELNELDGRAFGYPTTEESLAASKKILELDRFVVARDGADMVGCGGNFSMELTLPGKATVPMAGVTWVAVATTHRRVGIASEIMSRLDDDANDHGDPLIGLTASEGGIYERFGYGAATWTRITSLDRRRVQLAPQFKPQPRTVRLVDHVKHTAQFQEIYDRYRRQQVGETSRPPALFEESFSPQKSSRQVGALHQDGYAIWNIDPDWNDGDPAHKVRIWDLVAVTEEAYLALWDAALSIDLAAEISSRSAVGPDEPLPYFLTNPRALKTSHLGDHLWLKVLDPATAFSARGYRTTDRFLIQMGDGRLLQIDNEQAAWVDGGRPDLTITDAAAGPLLLGSIAPSTLVAGKRAEAEPDVLARADAFFAVSPTPHCRTGF